MSIPHDIEAEIYFLPTEHGGKSRPAMTGYRPQFYYDGRDWDSVHEYLAVEKVSPGEKVRAFIGFLSPQEHINHIYEGMAFLVREGNRTLGFGAVTRIVDLEKSASKKR